MLRERASEAVVCAVQITSDALDIFRRRGPSRAAVLDRVSYKGNAGWRHHIWMLIFSCVIKHIIYKNDDLYELFYTLFVH